MDAVTRGTAAVEMELDSILDMLHSTQGGGGGGTGRRPPPPASRLALAALPRVALTAEDLERLGADSVCAVCTEELKLGDEVQVRDQVAAFIQVGLRVDMCARFSVGLSLRGSVRLG